MQKIIVIGGGPAGYPAALEAARLGAEVVLIEKQWLGGVCLNCGCIPSKSFLDAAHKWAVLPTLAAWSGEGADELALQLIAKRDFAKIQARQQKATQKLVQGIQFLLKKANVKVVMGTATLVDEHTVAVKTESGSEMFQADGIILATGSKAFFPPPFDAIQAKIYDNSTLFSMPALPRSMAIIGGGVIGCEMADFLNALGVEVHIVEMQPRLLPLEEEGASRALAQAFTKRGIKLHLGVSAQQASEIEDGWKITLSDGAELQAEKILAAIGRAVDVAALQLDKVGVEATRKGVPVNPHTLQLKNNIYAAGDITGLCQLAHAATRQGEVAARNLCGVPAQYHNEAVPRAIYTSPEIAAVGLTRAQAEAQGHTVKAHKSFLLANGRAVAQDQTEGYVELFSDAQTGQLLGASLVCAGAAELVHIISVALQANMTVAQLQEVIFAHPTLAESIAEAVRK